MSVISDAASRPLRLTACAAVAWLGLAAGAAQAAQIQGSSAIFTSRPCTAPFHTTCDLSLPRNYTEFNGGFGQTFFDTTSNEFGRWQARVSFVENSFANLPVIGVSSLASANTRVGSSATGFRSYKNTSSFAIDLALRAELTYTTTLDLFGQGEAGEGHLNALFGIMPIEAFAGYQTFNANQIISHPFNTDPTCGEGGTLAGAHASSEGRGAGIGRVTIQLTQGCNGGRIRIAPGQEYVVVATLQALSNRGGAVNAMHTFAVDYDYENTFIAGTDTLVGEELLRESIQSAIPEPSAWALLITGFAGLGAALRRRHSALA